MSGVRFRLIAVVVLMAAVGACTTSDNRAPRTETAGPMKPEIVVATGADSNRVEPAFRATVATGAGDSANAPVFEPLVLLAPDFTVKPLLATAWQFRAPNTWRFTLRPGVRFHNGAPFDAKAVAYNVTELWAKETSGILSMGPDSAVVVDDYTVDITPTKPNQRLVEQLVHPSRGIRAPGTFAGAGTSSESTPTGTGPFKFTSYTKGESLKVERFEGYWGPKAKSQRITFRYLPDENSRVLALKAGDVDAIADFPREQAARFANDPDVTTVKSPVGAYAALLLNHLGAAPYDILSDPKVRQAVATGIDKSTIVNNVWKGNAEVTNTLIPTAVLGRNASAVKGYAYDRTQARRLLDEAGWAPGPDGIRAKAGRRLELTLVVSSADVVRPAPELVQSQLKDAGIDVKLDIPGTPATYFDRLEKGEGDMFIERGNQNDANAAFLGALFTAVAGGFADYAKWFAAGPQYDQLFTSAVTSPDVEETRRLTAQAIHIAVDEVIATVPIAGIYQIWGLRPNVHGFQPHPSAVNQRWNDVDVAL